MYLRHTGELPQSVSPILPTHPGRVLIAATQGVLFPWPLQVSAHAGWLIATFSLLSCPASCACSFTEVCKLSNENFQRLPAGHLPPLPSHLLCTHILSQAPWSLQTTHYHPGKGSPSTHAPSPTLSFARHPQLVSPIPFELLSSAHKHPVPSGRLYNGCQLDRASDHQRRGPRLLWRRGFRFDGGGLFTMNIGGTVPCVGVLDWKGDQKEKPVDYQHSLTYCRYNVTRWVRLWLPWIASHNWQIVNQTLRQRTLPLVSYFHQVLSYRIEKSNVLW